MRTDGGMGMTGMGGTMGGAMGASNGLDQIGEEGDRLPEGFTPDGVISLETFIDMRNIWSVFDLDETNKVSVGELRTILRALDIDPSEDELHAIRKQIDP